MRSVTYVAQASACASPRSGEIRAPGLRPARRLKSAPQLLLVLLLLCVPAVAQHQMEKLGRGVVAVHQGEGKIFVGWRLLGTDPDAIEFNVYRAAGGSKPVKLNAKPI